MDSLQPGLSATPAILTVELDLHEVAAGRRPPGPLSPAQAEQLAAAIGNDLQRILGAQLQQYGLIVAGALYDLTELLQPGLPFLETLLELYRGSLPPGQFRPQVVAIGSNDGEFPVRVMAPARRPGSGPLLGIPLLLVGPGEAIDTLQEQLETVLLEQGRAALETEQRLHHDFGLQPVNLAYATVNDLCALLKVQLERNELADLWALLESALYRPEQKVRSSLPGGNQFFLQGKQVYSPFYTFDQWRAQRPQETDPIAGYGEWVLTQRQYMAGLAAHGLEVTLVAGIAEFKDRCANSGRELARQCILPDQSLLREPDRATGNLDGAAVILLTEHATPRLGPVAYTVLVQATTGEVLHLANEYPLQPDAIASIRETWAKRAQALNVELHLARPGRLVLSDGDDHLIPDLSTAGGPH